MLRLRFMVYLYSVLGLIFCVALFDLVQKKHAILRNFPLIGHFRYWLELIGPELRQYIVTSNTEERPFDRSQRRWIYASSKKQNNYFGFGSDRDMELAPNYLIIKHSAFPYRDPLDTDRSKELYRIPCAKVMGQWRKRPKAFRPDSIVNISSMSFGSLSARAVEAMNQGAALCSCLQWTGEGGISRYHKKGGELVWQLGTGYFGCRDEVGRFSMERFKENVAANPVRAIEIKLSQGAKPGVGGMLPGRKVTAEISEARGIPVGKDCLSPAFHTEFSCADSLLDFVEKLAAESGLPVGIKSAVGDLSFWRDLARLMKAGDRAVDFITIDGGEGGTGAGPLVFADHVAQPFKLGFTDVYKIFCENDLQQKVVFIGSGKLGFPEASLFAFSLGCDMVNIAREAMLAVGCIQAQRCHTNHCPTGVATQSKWLMRGLDPTLKSVRLANYIGTLRHDILRVSWACGVPHPAFISFEHIDILDENYTKRSPKEVFAYQDHWGVPSKEDQEDIACLMGRRAFLRDKLCGWLLQLATKVE
ncbi:MAG: FMN-binding glutamate synthase family protein [Bdellovibrionota bacterium]